MADRDADLVAMMRCARDLGTPTDWLVRVKHNRCLPDEEGVKLWDSTTSGAALGEITFTMASRHGVKARPVRQQLWSRAVEIFDGKKGRVAATCAVARENG